MPTKTETLVILDYGSQYTQLIARRARELGVFSLILPYHTVFEAIQRLRPRGIVLSGGPNSVYEKGAPGLDKKLLDLGVPILGVCYGLQLLALTLGGKVEPSDVREYGLATFKLKAPSRLLTEKMSGSSVWMSHGDHVTTVPPGFMVTAMSGQLICAAENPAAGLYGLQFHPEVSHTEFGTAILKKFLVAICGFAADWTPALFIDVKVSEIKQTVGKSNVICALSGGVDSSVAATLVHRAIGAQQTCIFVDNGLLRQDEFEGVLKIYKKIGLNVIAVKAGDQFLDKLKGITDPEAKRKIIGGAFINVFDAEAHKIKNADFLVQGTLYPDVIESVSVNGPSAVIKSHHNVGGLPKKMKLKLIEPLRELFKDEVRSIGKELGLPGSVTKRQPFPGPGLAVRILGEVTPDAVTLLQKADKIVREEVEKADEHKGLWQYFAVLLPVKAVGVMGDNRTYEKVIAVRAITSTDGMTADWARLSYAVLDSIASRIISEVKGINRVVYDITSKPPGTIEWE